MILPQDFDFTQGNLQDYVDCPYRFYLRYIKRVKWPALVVNDAQDFEMRMQAGARFHRLIQQYLVGIPEVHINEMADEDSNTDLKAWWDNFLTHVPPLLEGQPYVETTLASSLAGQRVVAKYDLILVTADRRLIIFDWKTSNKALRVDWLLGRLQTKLYCFVLTQASPLFFGGQPSAAELTALPVEPERTTMNYWFTSQPETPVTLPYSQIAYAQDQAYLTQLVKEICTSKAANFHRTTDIQQCRFCVYRSHCDRGIEAGALAEFEDFNSEASAYETEISFEDIPEIKF